MDVLRGIDLKAATLDQIKEHLFTIFRGYVFSSPKLQAGTSLYRGVRCTDKPSNISELTHPPAARVTFFQRANRPGRPMFYCAVGREATIFELGMQSGEFLTIADWRITKSLVLAEAGFHEEVFQKLASNRRAPGWAEETHPLRSSASVQSMRRFLALEFMKKVRDGDDHLYKISAAITEKFIDSALSHPEATQFAGIAYPSVSTRGNIDNIALRPEAVAEGASLHSVEYVRVDRQTDELKYEVTVLDFANSFGSGGTIKWKGRRGQWKITGPDQVLVAVEHGRFVVRDMQGKIIEPD